MSMLYYLQKKWCRMKKHLLFIGNKFQNNSCLQHYVLRAVSQRFESINTISFFGDSDNTLFLELEALLQEEIRLIIVTSRSNAAVIGKLLSTITSDNQILKEQMLIPSRTTLFEPDSYVLEYQQARINVIVATENETLPPIILDEERRSAKLHIFNESAGDVKMLLEPLAQSFDIRFDLNIVVDDWIEVSITSRRYGNIAQFLTAAKQLLPNKLIASSNIVAYIIEKLQHANKKITFAESCTGGLLAAMFTKESGASAVFEGSLVTYSNHLKSNWLAVDDTVLERHGAVSVEVVAEMSEGALNVSYADYALSISGIAGPEGGSKEKPVGTVCLSARSKHKENHMMVLFHGDRNAIQEQSALFAIKMLLLLERELFF
jgi:nicotinamide-nucleotide amidase